MNHLRFFPTVILSVIVLLACTACSPSVTVNLNADASGKAVFDAKMTPAAATVVRKFTGLSEKAPTEKNGQTDTAAKNDAQSAPTSLEERLFDRTALTTSLAKTGFKVESVDFPAKGGISLVLSFMKIDGLLAQAVSMKPGKSDVSITLSRESINAAIDLMPPDTRDYLELLMAPVFSGEVLSVGEYEDIIATTYGKTLADDLTNARFTLTVICPAAIRTASVTSPGTVSKKAGTAVFTIPLTTLLTMETPVVAKVAW